MITNHKHKIPLLASQSHRLGSQPPPQKLIKLLPQIAELNNKIGLLSILNLGVCSLVLQNIIAYEYVPAFTGQELPEYKGYNMDTHPGITHVFQSAAFRFGHTLIPPGIYRRDGQCNFRKTPMGNPALRLCSHWWDSSVSIITMNPIKMKYPIRSLLELKRFPRYLCRTS